MLDVCSQLPHWVSILALVLYQVFEWVMGKTKFGSMIGLFLEHPIQYIASLLKKDPEQK